MEPLRSASSATSLAKKATKLQRDGSNYPSWKAYMTMVLDEGEVLELVTGEITGPVDDTAEANKRWREQCRRLKTFFAYSLEATEFQTVSTLNPVDAWRHLERRYSYSKAHLWIGIYKTSMSLVARSSADVPAYLDDYEKILTAARESKLPIYKPTDPTWTAAQKEEARDLNIFWSWHILSGLPKEPAWDSIVAVYTKDESSSWVADDIIEMIRSQANHQKLETISSTSSRKNSLFDLSHQSSSSSSSPNDTALSTSARRNDRPPCKFCKRSKPTHAPEQCWSNPKNPNNKLGGGSSGGSKGEGGGSGGNSGGGRKRGKGGKGGGNGENVSHVTFGADCALLTDSKRHDDGWYLDSGSSLHITNDRSNLSSVKPFNQTISCAQGGVMEAIEKGTITLESVVNGSPVKVSIHDVAYVPRSKWNLISLPTLSRHGAETTFFTDESFQVRKNGQVVFAGSSSKSGIYRVEVKSEKSSIAVSEDQKRAEIVAFHRKMGHPGKGAMRDLLKAGYLKGCSTTDLERFFKRICPPCVQGKSSASPFPRSPSTTSQPLAKLHSDIAGPMTQSFGGARYFILLVDEGTDYVEAEPMKDRTEVAEKFEKMLNRMKSKLSPLSSEFSPSTVLQTDNGTEYLSNTFQSILARNGIHHQTSIAHTPAQNGKAERTVRTIKEKITTLLNLLVASPVLGLRAM